MPENNDPTLFPDYPPVPSLADQLEEAGVEMEELDALVHDAAGAIASSVNNSSLSEQVEFLQENGFTFELERLLRDRVGFAPVGE